jgi:hypothetical protein
MWALVNDKNEVTEIIKVARSIVVDDVRHPRTIFGAWSWSELNAIGIYQVEDSGTKGNNMFQITSEPTYTFDASNKKVTTKYTITDKPLDDSDAKSEDGKDVTNSEGEKIINVGLKTIAKNNTNKMAHDLISRFSWLVERNIYDSSKAIPDAVKTYVAAIQKDADDIVTAITNAKDMTAFIALHTDEMNSDGTLKTMNRINRWTSDSTVKEYIR